jgi:hypothetical protein
VPVDIQALVGDAWRLTQRQRGFWLFGFFAGTASGGCQAGSSGGSTSELQSLLEGPESPVNQAEAAAALQQLQDAALPLVVLLVPLLLFFLVLGITFWLLGIACTGALLRGGADLERGEPVTVGQAWRRGLRSFSPLFVQALLLAVFWLVVGAGLLWLMLGSRGPATGRFSAMFQTFEALATAGTIIGLLATVIGVLVAYAQRAIVLDEAGAVESFGVAWDVVRRNLGQTFLVWIVGVALYIAGTIALVLVAVLAAIPSGIIGAVGVAVGSVLGSDLIQGLLVAIAFVTWLTFIFVGIAVLNTYFWHYWTLTYLRLTRQAPPPPQTDFGGGQAEAAV